MFPHFFRISCLTLLLCGHCALAKADEPQTQKAGPVIDSTEFELHRFAPDASPEETLQQIASLWQTQIDVSSPEATNRIKVRVLNHIIDGAEILLESQEVDQKFALKAVQHKMEALGVLAQAGDPEAVKNAIGMARKLTEDPRPLVAREGKLILLSSQLSELQTMSSEQREEYVKKLLSVLGDVKTTDREMQIATMTASYLQRLGDLKVAKTIYQTLAESARKAEMPDVRARAEEFDSIVRRLELPGSSIDVSGKTLAGDEFDLKGEEGKVVLIQFWASWCEYCLQEMPHILQMYNTYHEEGFEVVGINLDESPRRAQQIVKEMKLPWKNLHSREADSLGLENPNATRYGITTIPQCILVDREGKVVSLNARGEELSRLLEGLFLEKVETAETGSNSGSE